MSLENNLINWEMVREYSKQYGKIVPNVRFGKDAVVPDRTQFAPSVNIQPKWNLHDKIMINTTICGGFFSKDTNPNIPITTKEIYEEARAICLAGAPMIHVHVRDDNGYNTLDYDKFHEVLDPIKEEFPDVIIDGCLVANRPGYWEAMETCLKEKMFDISPVNCTANYAGDRVFAPYPYQIIEKCELLLKYGCKPHLAVFNDGDVDNAYRYLIAPGLLEKPYTWCVVPGLPGCSPTSSPDMMIESVVHMVHRIREISDQRIMVCSGGRGSSYMTTLALIMGLDIRVGMEDTIWKWPHKDDVIESNAECFKNFKTIANILGREVYTAKELREAMGLKR